MKCDFYEDLRKLHLPEKFLRHTTCNGFQFNRFISSRNEIVIKSVATFFFAVLFERCNQYLHE